MDRTSMLIVFAVLCILPSGCKPRTEFKYKDDPKRTPLTNAVAAGDVRRVKALIVSHADVNEEDSLGEVPMQCAAQSKTPEIVTALLQAGANVNGQGHWGPSPLQMAVEMTSGDPVIAKQLIEAGADVKAESGGYSVLNIAAQDANSEEVRLLLERGADPNHVEPNGGIALYWTALNCDVEKTRLLLQFGADPTKSIMSNKDLSKECAPVRSMLETATAKYSAQGKK